jgi:hypothetical protein
VKVWWSRSNLERAWLSFQYKSPESGDRSADVRGLIHLKTLLRARTSRRLRVS